MALKLNATREACREFYGQNVEQMLKLIADGRTPMNTAQLMQRRLDVRNSDDVKSAYMDNYFDTGDAVVYHPDGRVKIVLDSQTLRDMTPESPRSNGALILASEVYDPLQGEEFKKGKLSTTDAPLSREEVKAHPVWKFLARDQGLLNDYTDYIFGEYQARFAKGTSLEDVRAMGVFPDSAGDQPKMRAWVVDGLEYGSNARGRSSLVDGGGRFVCIAPEALSAPVEAKTSSASGVKPYTIADLQAFDKAMGGLEAVVRSDVLKPLVNLRRKLYG